jgi:phosphopantetheine--protein transferase-like protein
MILGIGVDLVEVGRFKSWLNYSEEQLLKIFSPSELEVIFSGTQEIAMQRMATRYAAKEAFYKAFSAMLIKLNKTQKTITFMSICRAISVLPGYWDVPVLAVDWKFLEEKLVSKMPEVDINLSLSHEKNYAVAYVIIQNMIVGKD